MTTDRRDAIRVVQTPPAMTERQPETTHDTELRAFMLVLYRALKMLTSYIEKNYHL